MKIYRLSFEPRAGEWLVVPLHHIFGTEELSALAPAYRRAQPQSHISRSIQTMRRDLGLAAGDEVQLRLRRRNSADGLTPCNPEPKYRLPVRFKPELLHGTAGLPVGLPVW